MIYTLGHAVGYRRGMAERAPRPLLKVGRLPPGHPDCPADRPGGYPGGSVWRTYEEARAHLEAAEGLGELAVFGVEADWDTQTAARDDGALWHDLLVDAPLVDLEPPGGITLRFVRRDPFEAAGVEPTQGPGIDRPPYCDGSDSCPLHVEPAEPWDPALGPPDPPRVAGHRMWA
jgi:hypothetical protein